MFDDIRDRFLHIIKSRATILTIIFILLGVALIYRCFNLQIVQGATYLEEFVLKTEKTRSISSTRGSIMDRNGKVLAYDELAYSVKIEDVTSSSLSSSARNAVLNENVYKLINLIEKNGDSVITDFSIFINEDGNFEFSVSDTQLLRFLADVYGLASVNDLTEEQRNSTAEDVIEFLGGTGSECFRIGDYETENDRNSEFIVGKGYTKEELLKMVTIRYAMKQTSYSKYVGTVVARDVSEKTVAAVLENSDEIEGISIEEDTVRRYVDSEYFAHILGYTGNISSSQLDTLNEEEAQISGITDRYTSSDVVGKNGIESYMESSLQGYKGSETVVVDTLGTTLAVTDSTPAVAGSDVVLTIDADLQIACYQILEQKIAGILLSKLTNAKTVESVTDTSKIQIPIYDVYFAVINNNVVDISHFSEPDAGEKEQEVYAKFKEYQAGVYENLREELVNTGTRYCDLSVEYQVYESNIVSYLTSNGVLISSAIDTSDETYIAWTNDEVISLREYLNYCIGMGWVDVSILNLEEKYVDAEEIYDRLVDYIIEMVDSTKEFQKRFYKYMLLNDVISGKDICMLLCEQDAITIPESDRNALYSGTLSAYQFMVNRITNLELTPAQLALDPCNGSVVIVDVNSGEVLAMVTYPGYDNNKLANSIDADYWALLTTDKSNPMLNYATQYKSAPGSTYKMVTATAGLMEGVITTTERINCVGQFNAIENGPRCWNTWGHGNLNVSGAITNSCNYFFYEVGYRLSTRNGYYNTEEGLATLAEYAGLYGLSEKSGVEISEYDPDISDMDPVRSAIGQGTNSYTTVGLARYVTAVANSGTVYNLTLLKQVQDADGEVIWENEPDVRNTIEMDSSYWDAIHSGMKGVVDSSSSFDSDMTVEAAGKTGTAQQSASRPPHALFLGYAPYDEPEIAIAVRIPFGYSSSYAAQVANDILEYYYGSADEVLTGTANLNERGVTYNEE